LPEGHTLYRLAADLERALGHQVVAATSPQGRFVESANLIDGSVLESAESAGKHLFMRFDNGQILHVHLGLIGGFSIMNAPPAPPVGAVRLRLLGPSSSADLRGATICELLSEEQIEKILSRLGPDPLRPDADPGRGFARLRSSRRPVGALLMDQRVLAGVGNIFRAESLFRARLHPLTPGERVSRRRWDALWTDLVGLMAYGVQTGRIDTVRPEHEPEAMGREPRADKHGGEVYVYRRGGQPCHVCGGRVKTQVLEGRNLYWCSSCQRRR